MGNHRYVFGETTDEVLEYVYALDDPDEVYYLHTDKLGSIMLAVDGSGAIQESYRYTEFGQMTVLNDAFNKTTRTISYIHNSKRYTARDKIPPAVYQDDWYHYRARTYRADAGRFVQRDPVRAQFPLNEYTYVNSRPMDAIDPTGMVPFDTGRWLRCRYDFTQLSSTTSGAVQGSSCDMTVYFAHRPEVFVPFPGKPACGKDFLEMHLHSDLCQPMILEVPHPVVQGQTIPKLLNGWSAGWVWKADVSAGAEYGTKGPGGSLKHAYKSTTGPFFPPVAPSLTKLEPPTTLGLRWHFWYFGIDDNVEIKHIYKSYGLPRSVYQGLEPVVGLDPIGSGGEVQATYKVKCKCEKFFALAPDGHG